MIPAFMPHAGLAAAVRAFFSNGEQGVWYDPSDRTTLYQDAAGTTPVTAMEQPVGLILDKSKGLVLGPELVTNGDFSNGTTGWNAISAQCSIANGVGHIVSSDGSYQNIGQAKTLAGGRWYELSVDIVSVASGGLNFAFVGGGVSAILLGKTAGTKRARFYVATTATSTLDFYRSGVTDITIDNISVRELPGNHCTFKAGTGRPVLSARYNLYVGTEALATQNVTTVATNYKLTFTGTGTITLSGTATGTYSAGTHTITCTAGTLTSTVSGTVTKADFRAANDGIGLPAYQRVVDSATYDTAGFPAYLRADGTDDSGSTNSIDFTSTDKITVFAGVRKLSDAATGVPVELNVGTGRGTFGFSAPSPMPANNYRWYSNGTAFISVVASGFTSPIANVLTGTGDISGDSAILRVNGAQAASNTGDQGTGNYGNYPLYLFARNNASLYFNGRLYGLIVLGRAATAMEIANTERYLNQRGRIY